MYVSSSYNYIVRIHKEEKKNTLETPQQLYTGKRKQIMKQHTTSVMKMQSLL